MMDHKDKSDESVYFPIESFIEAIDIYKSHLTKIINQ
jgi:hypothetical protein